MAVSVSLPAGIVRRFPPDLSNLIKLLCRNLGKIFNSKKKYFQSVPMRMAENLLYAIR